MTQTILNGSAATTEDLYVGLNRELSVDDSAQDLRLHDGVTPGGSKILNRDNADNRYQVKNPELDGLDFPPESQGLVIRLGAGDYTIRQVVVDPAGLELTNGNGTLGDITIVLADTITGARTFQDLVTFSGGIHGDLTGDLTGNVEGDLTGDSTGKHTGDVDVSDATLTLAEDQIDMAAINGLSEALTARNFPTGGIIMWAGTIDTVPAGWHLCDGSAGTPNLQDRFIMGRSDTHEVNTTGGASTHTHTGSNAGGGGHTPAVTVANHTLTVTEMPAHSHGSGVCDQSSAAPNIAFNRNTAAASPNSVQNINTNGGAGDIESITESIGGGGAHNHDATAAAVGDHTHALTVDSASNVPPYYVLAFIQKTA